MLKIDGLSVSYKRKGKSVSVLENFSMEVKKGKILAMIGPSGCGKSTLIHVLAGMISPDFGTIQMIQEKSAVFLNPHVHNIAVIPQNCGLLPWKSVKENCLLPLKLKKERIDDAKNKELENLCNSLQVSSFLERYPRELSGGQVQRVALARAFLQSPELLLMDEPFSSLDAITRMEAWEVFLKVWKKKQCTTILVTHSIEEAMYLGNEILVFTGEEKMRVTNPYFGQIQTEESYLKLKNTLHDSLQEIKKEEML